MIRFVPLLIVVLCSTSSPALADSTGTAEGYLSQAQSLFDTGKIGDAKKVYEEALREAYAVGQNNPKLPEVLESVADFYRSQNDFQRAEDMYTRALKLVEQRSGKNHIDVAKLNTKIGQMYLGEFKYAQAADCFQASLHIYERKLQKDANVPNFNRKETNLAIAGTLDDLARCVHSTRGALAAEGLYARSSQIRANPSANYHE